MLSNFKSSPTTFFSSPCFARFPSKDNKKQPGPGEYFVPAEFLNSGYQFSQNKYQGARKFSRSSRDTFYKKDMNTPGPGSYRLPSEFGYYENNGVKRGHGSMPNLRSGKNKT